MLVEKLRGSRKISGAEERTALEKGIAEAQATMQEASGCDADEENLRATLQAFIAQCERRIAEIRAITGR
jgi:hypothetical protein